MPDSDDPRLYFEFFNEIGIIEQLSRTLFEARLPRGVLVSHFSILNHLIRVADGRTPLELARAFQVPKTTMSHSLGLLTRKGWVEMRPNPSDARSKCVWITEAGRRFREEAIDLLIPDIESLARSIPAETVRALLPGLRHIRGVLDAARAEPDPRALEAAEVAAARASADARAKV